MSDHSLPDDLSQWPTDPYQLLGVRRGIAPRELRQAYTRLIRIFKPEQYPNHFRRVREAYETVLQQVQFYRSLNISFPEEDKETGERATEQPAERDRPEQQPDSQPQAAKEIPRPEDELDSIWQRACSGEEAVAYWALRGLHDRQPGNTGYCLRLYWLLALMPELDPERSPCHWLVQGLYLHGPSGPLRELYRREVAENPGEAFSQRFDRLLQLPMGSAQLADLIEWRLRATGSIGHVLTIERDLELLRTRLAVDEAETWLRLLILAGEQLLAMEGDEPRRLLESRFRQIKQLGPDHPNLASSIDRLEFLIEVAAGISKLRQLARFSSVAPLLDMVTRSWIQPLDQVRPTLLAYLAEILLDPAAALSRFDQLQQASGPVLAEFGNLLLMLEGYRAVTPVAPGSILGQMIRNFIVENTGTAYSRFRQALLTFCLQEVVSPEVVAEFLEDGVAHQVNSDRPLRCLCLAHRVFWK